MPLTRSIVNEPVPISFPVGLKASQDIVREARGHRTGRFVAPRSFDPDSGGTCGSNHRWQRIRREDHRLRVIASDHLETCGPAARGEKGPLLTEEGWRPSRSPSSGTSALPDDRDDVLAHVDRAGLGGQLDDPVRHLRQLRRSERIERLPV